MPHFPRLLLAAILAFTAIPAYAEEDYKPDDQVALDLSAEGWVTTTTARVTVNVDAAGAGNTTGTMREAMQQAVGALAKADWRLVNFSRSQDQTGLERWNAGFEARVPENQLGGIHDTAKKLGKAGMQLTVVDIAFDPTLAETEAVKTKLRGDIYKQVSEQLAALNTAFPNRQYRVGAINFNSVGMPPMMPRPMMMKATMAMSSESAPAGGESMERAQKITQQAQVVFAALAPVAAK